MRCKKCGTKAVYSYSAGTWYCPKCTKEKNRQNEGGEK